MPTQLYCLRSREHGLIIPRVYQATRVRDRGLGLLARPPLAANEGLWIVPCGSVHTWGMRYPIDVVFLARDLTVLRVISKLDPWRIGRAPRGTASVLELAAGAAAALRAGHTLVAVVAG